MKLFCNSFLAMAAAIGWFAPASVAASSDFPAEATIQRIRFAETGGYLLGNDDGSISVTSLDSTDSHYEWIVRNSDDGTHFINRNTGFYLHATPTECYSNSIFNEDTSTKKSWIDGGTPLSGSGLASLENVQRGTCCHSDGTTGPCADVSAQVQFEYADDLIKTWVIEGEDSPTSGQTISPTPNTAHSGEYSFAFWLKLHSGSGGHWRNIFQKGGDNMKRGPAIYMQPNKPKVHLVSCSSSHSNSATNTGWIPYEEYVHVTLVHDDSDIRVYVNGVLENDSKGVGGACASLSGSDVPFYFSSNWVNGAADVTVKEVVFMDYAWSEIEIDQVMLMTE